TRSNNLWITESIAACRYQIHISFEQKACLMSISFEDKENFDLALMETDSAKLYFLYGKMRAMDDFSTIDTSHTYSLVSMENVRWKRTLRECTFDRCQAIALINLDLFDYCFQIVHLA
ncbi:hypothetical protein SFRURICE_007335, partial [Spodoptera frugiperda]